MMASDIAPRCTGSPVGSVGPTADFYKDRSEQLARACAAAMKAGDIHLANDLYDRGITAFANHLWHARLAQMIGTDLTLMAAGL